MADYIILTDSCADLPMNIYEALNVEVVPLSFLLEGKTYKNHPDQSSMKFSEVYGKLRDGANISTSAVNVEEFRTAYLPHLQAGKDILYLGFSSGLSGTCNAGAIAAKELMEEYPDRTITVVDTLCAALGQGLLVYLTAKKQAEGATLAEAAAYAEELKPRLVHWFTVDDLFFLKRGGRLSGATALVGSALGIKPVLHVDDEGHLVKVSTVRGRKNSLKELANKMAETAIDPQNQTIFIAHGDCFDDAKYLADCIKETCGYKDVIIDYVGPVIGAHSGPGTIALFYLGTHR